MTAAFGLEEAPDILGVAIGGSDGVARVSLSLCQSKSAMGAEPATILPIVQS